MKNKNILLVLFFLVLSFISCNRESGIEVSWISDPDNNTQMKIIHPLELSKVKISDGFWSPKLYLWRTKTVNDIFDKFEGKYVYPGNGQKTSNAFSNYDLVAEGKRGIGQHDGRPWFDGLIYETIRGAADLLVQYPDEKLEERVDGYINRIEAAQNSEPDGYINTYTQLVEPEHRWGFNGGFLRLQHDVYNAGMLFEAAVHYYRATGKVKLLNVAVKMANLMCGCIGEVPKMNVVPAHSGPEEALLKMYWLFKENPELKNLVSVNVDEDQYYHLVRFWIESRGDNCGYPLWKSWGDSESEKWVKSAEYAQPKYGDHSRPSWGDYAQDSIPIIEQKTIEGHAVRATLLATGIATLVLEDSDNKYFDVCSDLWKNMVGKRMYITGGVGSTAKDEKFGSDYYLPEDGYLETCAAVGAGFFSERMHELTGNAIYMDEFERVLYNNVLSGISLSGDHYSYINPLISESNPRWRWTGCPCCPPMFLKMVSAMPGFIYSCDKESVYVNLFVGSEANISIEGINVTMKQETRYPWDGQISLQILPDEEKDFTVRIRIPGWAQGIENPFGLYHSQSSSKVGFSINGENIAVKTNKGYAEIKRKWKKGDCVKLVLPIEPRIVYAHDSVTNLNNKVALASGPIVYCLEANDNPELSHIMLDTQSKLTLKYKQEEMNGVNFITGRALFDKREHSTVSFSAIPFFANGNRKPGNFFRVWIPIE